MSDTFTAKSTISTELFEELCGLKRSAFDVKAELEADLYDRLDIHSDQELDEWKERYLSDLLHINERYRSSSLAHLRASARRARFCRPAKTLSDSLNAVTDVMCESRGTMENLIGAYESITPQMRHIQQAFMKREIQWMRRGLDTIEGKEKTLRLTTEQTNASLQLLTLPAAQFEAVLRPLTKCPPVISYAAIEPLCDELSQFCAERRNIAEKISDIVVDAFVTWFDMKTPEADQRATLEKVSGWCETIKAQRERQHVLLTSVALFKDRAAHAPSVLVTTESSFEVSDLLTAMHEYDDIMDEISDVYDKQAFLLQKAKVSVEEITSFFSRPGDKA